MFAIGVDIWSTADIVCSQWRTSSRSFIPTSSPLVSLWRPMERLIPTISLRRSSLNGTTGLVWSLNCLSSPKSVRSVSTTLCVSMENTINVLVSVGTRWTLSMSTVWKRMCHCILFDQRKVLGLLWVTWCLTVRGRRQFECICLWWRSKPPIRDPGAFVRVLWLSDWPQKVEESLRKCLTFGMVYINCTHNEDHFSHQDSS